MGRTHSFGRAGRRAGCDQFGFIRQAGTRFVRARELVIGAGLNLPDLTLDLCALAKNDGKSVIEHSSK